MYGTSRVQVRLTDEQIAELKEMFPNCPNPKYQPIQFKYYVRMYLYFKGQRIDTYV